MVQNPLKTKRPPKAAFLPRQRLQACLAGYLVRGTVRAGGVTCLRVRRAYSERSGERQEMRNGPGRLKKVGRLRRLRGSARTEPGLERGHAGLEVLVFL